MTLRFQRLDHQGVAEVLKSTGVREVIHAAAQEIAAAARAQRPGADIVVDDYVTDRAASSVTVREVAAMTWQVRDGILTRAATGAGLEVTER